MPDTAVELDRIVRAISYNPDTGEFRWKIASGRQSAGSIAGGLRGNGYCYVMVGGKTYLAHRLAWLLVHGNWPTSQIDHIDRNRANNAISNLREATPHHNVGNVGLLSTNTSGYRGVSWDRNRKKWAAYINHGQRRRFLGYFQLKRHAAQAHDEAAREHFGQFAYLNLPEAQFA